MILAKSYLPTTGNTHYDIWMLFRQAYEIVDEYISRECQLRGTTVSAYQALYVVKFGPKPMTAYRLAQILGRKHHSIVELVNRIKRNGWLTTRTIDGKPALELTEVGSELVEQITSSGGIDKAFKALDGARLKQFRQGLALLREAGLRQLGVMDMGEVELRGMDDS